MASNVTEDLHTILNESRKLSIGWKHGLISTDHLFMAMLKNNCLASPFLGHCDAALWESKIKLTYPPTGKETLKDGLPLTVYAERTVKHCYKIARLNGETAINTIHLLLAFLSYDNQIKEAFDKAGILIGDITASCFSTHLEKLPPVLKQNRTRPYSKIDLFFFRFGGKARELARLQKNATNLFLYRQFNDCREICSLALTLAPDALDFKEMQACCYIDLRDFQSALVLLEELVAIQPGHMNNWLNLSYGYISTGNYGEAAKILDKLLQQQPKNQYFLNNHGFNLLLQQRFAESAPFFEMAVKKDPEFAFAWNNLGFAKYKLGELDEGLSLINHSLGLDKSNSYAYKNKGLIFMETGNAVEAIKNFELSLKFGYAEKYGDEVEQLLKQLT